MTDSATVRLREQPVDLPTRAAVQALVLLVFFASGLVDIPGSVSTGPISTQGLLTVAYFLSGLLLLPAIQVTGAAKAQLLPLLAFVMWAGTSLLWTTARTNGLQNVLVVSTLLLLLFVSASVAASDVEFGSWLLRQMRRSVFLGATLYAISALVWGAGNNELIGARSFGLFALLGVAHFLAQWRYGRRSGLLWASVLTFLIGVSHSRLALGIAIALFPLAQLPTRRLRRLVKMIIVSCVTIGLSYAAFQYFDALRERFLTGDLALRIGSVGINVSGRLTFWRVTMDSLSEHPIAGKGAGSTEGLIESVFLDIRHPHSDYLRIAHDYGLIGLALWIVSMIALLLLLWRSWRLADSVGRRPATLQLSAFLALVAFVLEMTMENAMVYIFVAAPLALVIGTALGSLGVIETHARARHSQLI
jgi:O-antigen ligase